MTLDQIATDAGLAGFTRTLFITYVGERFPDAEPIYLKEWAKRFKQGRAWAGSDEVGQALLRELEGGQA